jgi:DNA polymerase-1
MIKNRFVLIDAFALIFRAYHALPPFTTKDGHQVGAVYGFTSALLSAIKTLEPEYLAVGFDLPTKTVRHAEYIEYKAHRAPTPDDLMIQVPFVKDVLKTFNIPIFSKEGYEGEDVIASIIANCKQLTANSTESEKPSAVSRKPEANLEFIIVTGDLDCLQLVGSQTKVYSMARGINQATMYDIEKVKERYGLTPSQFVDFKALKGDASDNIPGVPGIGEKSAAKLIIEYKNLENIYKNIDKISGKLHTLLKENKDQAFLSEKLSKIVDDIEVDFNLSDAKIHDYNSEKVKKLFLELGFKSLVARLPEEKRDDPQQTLL